MKEPRAVFVELNKSASCRISGTTLHINYEGNEMLFRLAVERRLYQISILGNSHLYQLQTKGLGFLKFIRL